jgi:predicted nuclease of predicted toxin-antitoxin system
LKILLDANVPKRFLRMLVGHDVKTAQQCGWHEFEDGPLLTAIGDQFDVLVTCDQSLRFQQNLTQINFVIIVLRARTNRIEDLAPLAPSVLTALSVIKPGEVKVVGVS